MKHARDNAGRWLPGKSPNPKGRPPKALQISKLLEPRREELVQKAVELALDGDTTALKICLDRLAPPLKPTHPPAEVPGLMEASNTLDKCEAIINAAGSGSIGSDTGKALLDMLLVANKIKELESLEKRLEALEKSVESRSNM